MTVKEISRLLAVSSLIFPCANAVADREIDYSYVDLSYQFVDADIYQDSDTLSEFIDESQDGDGYALSAGYGFQNNVFIYGSYSNISLDFDIVNNADEVLAADTDLKTLVLGVGYAIPITRYTDIVSSIAYIDRDMGEFSLGQSDQDIFDDDTDFEDAIDDLNEDDSDGYSLDLGVRSQTTTWLELGGGVKYTEMDAGDQFTVFGNAIFEVSDYASVVVKADIGDELSTYEIGGRLAF